jgi:D-3-phosphoglycerate dehydrogenase
MADTTEALILDLLEWVCSEERGYAETMEAWRTSCPRLPVWEEANDRGLVTRDFRSGNALVRVTAAGRELLKTARSAGLKTGNPRR